MKDKPILFSGPMVRAILEGRKTMTRRVVKFPEWFLDEYVRFGRHEIQSEIDCPYQVGDRLWVRETWATWPSMDKTKPSDVYHQPLHYLATFDSSSVKYPPAMPKKWRPSIFMPRWASRITLRVTGVKVERVQEISEEDAKAEGIFEFSKLGFYGYDETGTPGPHCRDTARETFRCLWDSINVKRGFGWDKNPWCWCYTFEVVK